jgi:beta-xylosidase
MAYGGIGVAVADKPEGPFKDYLGKPLLDKIVNKAQPIDQFVFQDRDGRYYMIYGGWRHCNMARLKDDFTGFVPFEDGTVFKEFTPQGSENIILCGRKVAGAGPITGWPMPYPILLLAPLTVLVRYCSRIPL